MESFAYHLHQPHHIQFQHHRPQHPVFSRPLAPLAAPPRAQPPRAPPPPKSPPTSLLTRDDGAMPPRSVSPRSGSPRTTGRVAARARVGRGMSKKVRTSKSNVPGTSRYWTPSEHKLFVEALLRFGPKSLKQIAAHVGTRNMTQCRTHEQKCFMRLMKEAQKETAKRAGIPTSAAKAAKDVYSVSASCGITLLCVVGEEMSNVLQS